ncbi:MAG: NAD(P)-binding protein [Polyangiaceae bacterium]|nr:NAD(P)-binding protein [Polyangiaceae bacterium]
MSGDGAYDVVVVGSGLGGLTTSLLVARLGRKVALVEARTELGGVSRSFRRRGVDCPVGIHYFGAAGPGELVDRVWSALGLSIPLQPAGRDGLLSRYHIGSEIFDLPVGFDAYEAALLTAVPAEREVVGTVVRSLRDAAAPLKMQARVGGFEVFETARGFLQRLGCSERLIRLLSGPEGWLGMPLSECPRSSFELALASYLLSSWRLACTGTELVERLAARLNALGGEVIVGDGVSRLTFVDGGVKGVILRSGRPLRADHVVLAVHPKLAVGLFGDEPGLDGLARRLVALPDSMTASMGFALVDAARTPARSYNTYHLDLDGGSSFWFQLTPSGHAGKNLLCVIVADDYQAWRRWEQTTTGNRGAEYLEAKAGLAERMLAGVRRHAEVGEVEWLDTFTPLSFRDWVGNWEGSLYGVSRGGLALAGLNRGVPGLRFVGQSLLAPGVVGVTFGALRVAGDLAGRAQLGALLEGAM